MKLKPLLAKPRTYGELTLEQHLIDTESAAIAIFKERILENWCRFFGVQDAERFLIHLRIAALFHDVGKANQEFYTSAYTNYWGNKQTLRHEWLSALILHLPNVREWLQASKLNFDLEVITAAVLSHHLKANRKDWGKPRPTEVKTLELYSNHPEITNILNKIGQIAKLERIPELPQQWIKGDSFWEKVYGEANSIGAKFGRKIKRDSERRALLLAVKAGVMVADSAASGIFRIHSSDAIEQWIDTTLHLNFITPEELEDKILQPRYRDIANKSKKTFKLKPFQQQAETLGDRLLLLAVVVRAKQFLLTNGCREYYLGIRLDILYFSIQLVERLPKDLKIMFPGHPNQMLVYLLVLLLMNYNKSEKILLILQKEKTILPKQGYIL